MEPSAALSYDQLQKRLERSCRRLEALERLLADPRISQKGKHRLRCAARMQAVAVELRERALRLAAAEGAAGSG